MIHNQDSLLTRATSRCGRGTPAAAHLLVWVAMDTSSRQCQRSRKLIGQQTESVSEARRNQERRRWTVSHHLQIARLRLLHLDLDKRHGTTITSVTEAFCKKLTELGLCDVLQKT